MSSIDSLLDEIDDELGFLDPPPAKPVTTTQTAGHGLPAPDDDDDEGVDIDVDQLDDLIADIERQDSTRRLPNFNIAEMKKPHGRKNPKFRQQSRPTGALDGENLDRILEEIQNVTKQRAAEALSGNVLGWGVLDTERKFDFLAPNFALPLTNVVCTLVCTNAGGSRARIPLQSIGIKVAPVSPSGIPALQHTLIDNKDGTYNIEFEPQIEGAKYQIQVDIYNQRQFEWDIQISSFPEPGECEAKANPSGYKAKQKGEVILQAKDRNGKDLKVGGAKVGLSFSGAGQLTDVGLLDRMDGTYAISFVPSGPGIYQIFLTVSGADIKTCPLQIVVKP